ncbi:MAG: hypothetical protein FD189_388 [Elusimicrobia bacterium]|nr:MAG: hypothetical protein FD154_468 [Elusimicrobiota bacterium]KAF0157867.1 MAG: hypothetical protein FD189_388 [Elusimicrobiota bacterium]
MGIRFWAVALLFPLLTGCASVGKRMRHQQEVQALITIQDFTPVQEPKYNDKVPRLSGSPLNLTPKDNFRWYKDRKAPKLLSPEELYFPGFSGKYMMVAKPEKIYELDKLKGRDKLLKTAGYKKQNEVDAFFLKNVETGNYTRLIPEGYSLAHPSVFGVSPDGGFLVYAAWPGYKLYMQPLRKKQPRKSLTDGSGVSAPFGSPTYQIALSGSLPALQFSPDGKFLAYLLNGVVYLVDLETMEKETITAGQTVGFDFNSTGNFLIYTADMINYNLYDLVGKKKATVPIDNVIAEMKAGVGLGGKLGQVGLNILSAIASKGTALASGGALQPDRTTKKRKKEKQFAVSDVSADGKHALVSIFTLMETKTVSQSQSHGYITAKTRTDRDIEPEKNIALNLQTGAVKRLFGHRGEGAAVEKPYFLGNGVIAHDEGKDGALKLYQISMERLFATEDKKMEKMVENGRLKLAFKPKGDKFFSPDKKYLLWQKGETVYCAKMGGGGVKEIKSAIAPKFSPDNRYLHYINTKDYSLYRIELGVE